MRFEFIVDAIPSKRKYTDEGYLIVKDSAIAKVGLQPYLASEIGISDSGGRINVFRSADEVFNDAAIESFIGKPLTNDHPPEFVDSKNWKSYTIGFIKDVRPDLDNNVLLADLVFTDEKAIKLVKSGKTQLSCGYNAEIIQDAGVYNGIEYQAVQKNIRGNHVSLVNAGRAAIAAVADKDFNNNSTERKTVNIEELKAGLAKLTDSERTSVIELFKPVQKLSDAEIQSQIETKANELAIVKANEMAPVMAKEMADKAIADAKDLNDLVTKAKGYIKDYQPTAEAGRRQVMLDVMKAAAANPTVKKLLDAMFGGVEPQTLSDSSLSTGFNFVTNMSKDLPYMVADNKTVVDHFSQSQKPATTMRIADAIKLTQCKVY